jgi:hypothetical protein
MRVRIICMDNAPGRAADCVHVAPVGLVCALLGVLGVHHATADEAQGTALDEVVVTAEKLPQPLQKAPEAITVIDGNALRYAGATAGKRLYRGVYPGCGKHARLSANLLPERVQFEWDLGAARGDERAFI